MPRLLVPLLIVGACVLMAPQAGAGDTTSGNNTSVGGSATGDGGEVSVSNPGAGHGSGGSGGGGSSSNPMVCRYYEIAAGPDAVGTVGAEAGGLVEGTQYWKRCTNTQTGVESLDLITGAAAVDPAQLARDLAEEAYARLVVPTPSAASNPPNGQAVVNVRVWLWVSDWSRRAESASAAGVTATVTAVPTQVRWDTGDGRAETCRGPGTAYDTSRPPEAQSTSCSHTYTSSTGRLTVSGTQSWHVTYTATNGQSGDLGVVSRTSTMPVDVHELVTNIRHP